MRFIDAAMIQFVPQDAGAFAFGYLCGSIPFGLLLGFGVWPALAAFCATWLGIAAATRYSSLAALVASAAALGVLWWSDDLQLALLFSVLTALLWIMHRANIARLASGTEGKIGAKPKA